MITEQSKKIVLPAYLVRRCEAFRIVQGTEHTYVVRDKVQGKTWDFEPWQFFILEVLPGCETLEKLQSVFHDRFNRAITKVEVEALFASVADKRLFDESALQHPLLAPFAKKTYDVVDGKAVPKSHTAGLGLGAAPAAEAPKAAPAAAAAGKEQPAGIEDAVGLDSKAATRMLDLFDPRPLLRKLLPVVAPLRHAMYALPLVLLVALVLVGKNSHLLVADLQALHSRLSLAARVIFVLLTVNVLATINTAFVAHAFRVSVERIGLTLLLGFIPRFVTRMSGTEQLTRRETMWLHGANLILRLFLFSLGVLLWFNTRDAGGLLPQVGLMFVLTVGASLLLEAANPLAKGSAYFLLAAFLNEPHLRGKAYKALANKLRGGVYQSADSTALALYALATITYLVGLVLFLSLGLLEWLLGHLHLGGSAVIVVTAFAGYLLWRNYVGLRKFGETYERTMQFDRWRTRTLLAEGQAEGEVARKRPSYWRRALVVGALLLLLVPYPYDVSGSFSIFPVRRQVISTDTPGLVDEVYFDGGETVKAGTVIARLGHDDYLSQVKVLDAQIAEQQSVVADLRARPRPQEVEVARQALNVATTRAGFSREKVPRVEKLYKAGAVSFEDLDDARNARDTDAMQVAEKQAALALASLGATPDEIAAAEAKLASLEQERGLYAAKLDRTVLRMPFDGNILTLHLKDRTNSYLDKGAPFASVENTGIVTAEIEVPESDVQYLTVGSTVRLRPVAYFNRGFEGKVTLIDRNVTAQSFGSVVKVIATIDNHDGLLKTGMTGEAKIASETMPLWKAFSQALSRFARIEVWSWIP